MWKVEDNELNLIQNTMQWNEKKREKKIRRFFVRASLRRKSSKYNADKIHVYWNKNERNLLTGNIRLFVVVNII